VLNNFTISTKLKLNSIIVLLGLVGLGGVSYTSLMTLDQEYHNSNKIIEQTSHMKSIMVGGLLTNSASAIYAFNTSPKAMKSIGSGLKKVKEFSSKLTDSPKIVELSNKFLAEATKVRNNGQANGYIHEEELSVILKHWRALKFPLQEELKLMKKRVQQSKENFDKTLSKIIFNTVVWIVILAAIIALINLLISQGVIKSLKKLETSMKNLANGTHNDKIEIESQDETASIATYFNQYLDRIESDIKQDKVAINDVKKVIGKVNAGLFNSKATAHAASAEVELLINELNNMIHRTESNLMELSKALVALSTAKYDYEIPKIEGLTGLLASLLNGVKVTQNTITEVLSLIDIANRRLMFSSEDLVKAAKELNEASHNQATSLEQTAASIEEVAGTIRSSTQNAEKMAALASNVTNSAEEGKKLANHTSTSMDEISTQVSSISEAITVIDQIAFQTNILSLNAAVEAATAGEAGKGFAVVAQEVRNLAARSADAAKEIKNIVEIANNKANEGKNISAQMIEGYNTLNQDINATIELIQTVATSSKEQEVAINQINDAVSVLDQATQNNAATAATISDMADSTQDLAQQLQTVVDSTSFDKSAKRRVCDSTLIFEANRLKADHILLKDNALQKCSEGTRFTITNENQCNLGKWINAHADSEFAKSEDWKELLDAHQKVHTVVQDTVDLYADDYANGQIIAATNYLEEQMDIVFNKFDTIREINCDHLQQRRG
jgi:methyl-accepting chemotaxis protein